MAVNVRKQPCLCISLENGATIIAAIEIIINFGFVCLGAITLSHLSAIHARNDTEEMHRVAYEITSDDPSFFGKVEHEPAKFFSLVYFFFAASMAKEIAEIIFASLLILGIRENRLTFLRMWLIFKGSFVCFGLLLLCSDFLLRPSADRTLSLLSNAMSCLIGFYFFYVVYRLHVEMRKRKMNTQRIRPRRGNASQAAQQSQQPQCV